MIVLQTERLNLRRLTVEDAPFILDLLNDPTFIQNIGDRGVRTLDDARHYIESGPLTSYQKHGYGLYLVEIKLHHTPVGICGLVNRKDLPGPDIGYALLPPFWSRGYAVESAAAVKAYALNELGLRQVLAIVNPDNAASIRVLQKIGLSRAGLIRLSADETAVQLFSSA